MKTHHEIILLLAGRECAHTWSAGYSGDAMHQYAQLQILFGFVVRRMHQLSALFSHQQYGPVGQ